jgi:hypothetical protein
MIDSDIWHLAAIRKEENMALKSIENYYTVAEVKKILGITNDMLYNYVENGALKRVIPPGKRQGLYKRSEVDQLARELHAFILQRTKDPSYITVVTTREEMKECLDISQTVFGCVEDDILDESMRMIEKNPYICFALRSNDQIVGYTGITPLKPGKMESVLAQTLPVRVSPEDMEVFEAGKNLDIYIGVMVVKPGFNPLVKHTYGSRLIANFIDVIVGCGEKGVSIGTIAARSNTADGIRLMRHAGFTEIKRATPERRTFVINVEQSAIPFIEQYKQAFANWQQYHS